MFNTGSNSFVLNKQSTVSYHGRTSLTSKHLFIAATRVSSTGSLKNCVFSPKPPSVPKLERVHFSAYKLTQIIGLLLLYCLAMFCNKFEWHPQMIYSNPPIGAAKLIMVQCVVLGEAELVMGKRDRGTCYNLLNEEVVQS